MRACICTCAYCTYTYLHPHPTHEMRTRTHVHKAACAHTQTQQLFFDANLEKMPCHTRKRPQRPKNSFEHKPWKLQKAVKVTTVLHFLKASKLFSYDVYRDQGGGQNFGRQTALVSEQAGEIQYTLASDSAPLWRSALAKSGACISALESGGWASPGRKSGHLA